MAFSSIASPASGIVVKSNISSSTCETITIKSAMVMFPSKNTRSSRLIVKAAEEGAARSAAGVTYADEDKSNSKPPPIAPKPAPRGKKVDTKQTVLADESNDIRDLVNETKVKKRTTKQILVDELNGIRDLINQTKGRKHNTKQKVLADESNDIRDLINEINTLRVSDINKITEYLKDMRDLFKSSKRIEELRILFLDTENMTYEQLEYYKVLCKEIKAKYSL